MDTEEMTDAEATEYLKQRFKELPKVIQDAITSADVEKRLRSLAETHKLHLDQWDALEWEVQMTLLGVKPLNELAQSLAESLEMPLEQATPLAADVTKAVFEPIREELERQLDHPEAKEGDKTTIELARDQALAASAQQDATTPAPTTPEPTAVPASTTTQAVAQRTPAASVVREAIPSTYQPGTASHERKAVVGDPYREQPL